MKGTGKRAMVLEGSSRVVKVIERCSKLQKKILEGAGKLLEGFWKGIRYCLNVEEGSEGFQKLLEGCWKLCCLHGSTWICQVLIEE